MAKPDTPSIAIGNGIQQTIYGVIRGQAADDPTWRLPLFTAKNTCGYFARGCWFPDLEVLLCAVQHPCIPRLSHVLVVVDGAGAALVERQDLARSG